MDFFTDCTVPILNSNCIKTVQLVYNFASLFFQQAGPKLSEYSFARISQPDELLATLGQALGVRGEVF
jgi:hypothetical protein